MGFLRRPSLVRLLCLIAVGVNVYYLAWRLLDTFNPEALWLSALLWAGEAYGLVMLALHIFLTWDTRALERRLGLEPGRDLSTAVLALPEPHPVDVFVPTYNESVGLLRKTVIAAREIRLPHRTWVLDDGRRDEVQQMCEELGVCYLTRDSNEHAKAGNINAALARTDGEFVVVLDADFIALPDLLERTLGHFEQDDKLAFVQLPQTFYNVDSVQHVDRSRTGWHEQSLFYDVIQPGKNRWNAAFWCGSPAVIRRAALEAVGGAATSTITEDILTSMRLHAAGWHSLYHDEVLAVGVAPGDLDGFRTQRLRWAQGSMQILRSRENPLLKKGLSLAQRLNYLASMTTYFQALQLAVFVAMPLLILTSGQSPISNFGGAFFMRFVPYMAITLAAIKATGGSSQRLIWDQYFSFLRMFTFLRALPTLLTGGRNLRFRVTPKSPGTGVPRAALFPHLGVALVNLAVVGALLALPVRHGLNGWTTAIVSVFAGLIAAVHISAVARLWRRVYRRHHYRLPLTLPAYVNLEGADSVLTQTDDISFGGLSITLSVPPTPQTQVDIRLMLEEGDELELRGSVAGSRPLADGTYRVGVELGSLPSEAEKRLLYHFLANATGTLVDGSTSTEDEPRPTPQVALNPT